MGETTEQTLYECGCVYVYVYYEGQFSNDFISKSWKYFCKEHIIDSKTLTENELVKKIKKDQKIIYNRTEYWWSVTKYQEKLLEKHIRQSNIVHDALLSKIFKFLFITQWVKM